MTFYDPGQHSSASRHVGYILAMNTLAVFIIHLHFKYSMAMHA